LQEAITHYSKAIELGEGDKNLLKTIYSNRSAANMQIKRFANALLDGEKCVELDCNWTKGYIRKGDALYSLTRYIEAYNAYNAGLRISPSDKALLEKSEQVQAAIRRLNEPSDTSSYSSSYNSGNASVLDGVQSWIRTLIVLSFFFYMLPLGRFITSWAYRLFVANSIACYGINIYRGHSQIWHSQIACYGIPKFDMTYAQRLVLDPSTPYLFMSILLFIMRPYLLAVGPILILETVQVLLILKQYV